MNNKIAAALLSLTAFSHFAAAQPPPPRDGVILGAFRFRKRAL